MLMPLGAVFHTARLKFLVSEAQAARLGTRPGKGGLCLSVQPPALFCIFCPS